MLISLQRLDIKQYGIEAIFWYGGVVPARPSALPPLGLRLARTAHSVTQAFERAMSEVGASVSTWQVLLLVQARAWGTQAEMADAMGVTTATLTHHLNASEADGLVRRWREPHDRRAQRVELTDAGEQMFARLRRVAMAHDRRLRSQLSEAQERELIELLEVLRRSVEPAPASEAATAGHR